MIAETSLQSARKAQTSIQSHLPACSQSSDIRDHLQDSAPLPPECFTRWQRVIPTYLHRWSYWGVHGLWSRYSKFSQPADRHIRLRKSGARFGQTERTKGWCNTSRVQGKSNEQCLAGICCSELGLGHVAISMAARDATAKSEK